MYDRQALQARIREKALKFGTFTLASGRTASYYLDCRQVTLDGRAANLIAEGLIEAMQADWPDAVGGMAIGADPITAAVITRASQIGHDLRGFIVRKESKQHGRQQMVEGPVQQGDRVIILEDVVTTGGSALLAIEHAESHGLKVIGVMAVVDRLEGGREAFAARGYPLQTLFTVSDFGVQDVK
ncbi:MAG: orotate phosphoribosyltransferase [Planctomycetota bacterium]|nr:orotate phosphoribosyltransferase [Planctomycetota bacterium]MDA1178746.1 orotate phosphoribosyltransferase [Planctomycetota bacterium]